MALLPRRAGLGFPSTNSRNRAPGPSPTRGALRGARESPVQLIDELNRTKETPTSLPAPCYAIIPARSFHALRVGNAGGELIRARGAHPAQPITLARSPHTARKTPKPSLRTSARRTTARRFVRCDLNSD